MSTVPLEWESQIRSILCTHLQLSCSLQDTYRYHREEAVRRCSCGPMTVLAVSVCEVAGPTNYTESADIGNFVEQVRIPQLQSIAPQP